MTFKYSYNLLFLYIHLEELYMLGCMLIDVCVNSYIEFVEFLNNGRSRVKARDFSRYRHYVILIAVVAV